jgi:pimeloyl-ACP methyl ester carboxylesterase
MKMRIAGAALTAIFGLTAASPGGFYDVPSPLPPGSPGSIIWQKPYTGGAQLRNAASNTLVLYHTLSASGRDVAVSGTIAIPKGSPPPGGWPIISWAHGTTGNAPRCAPSNSVAQNVEQQMLDQWVSAGFAVAQTDYEGEGTPGIHPYFAGVSGSHDVIDIVRAARHLFPSVGDRWIAMGHSEGGAVALFAASLANSWAPELHLLGAVAYAPAGDIPDFFGETSVSQQPTGALPLLMMMVQGIASVDPKVDLKDVLTAKGLAMLPSLQSACAGTLMNSPAWNSVPPASLFTANARSGVLMQDFFANEPANLHLRAPVLIVQGTLDELVPYQGSVGLRNTLCGNGGSVQFAGVQGGTHDSAMRLSYDRVAAWVADRLSGKPAAGCSAP